MIMIMVGALHLLALLLPPLVAATTDSTIQDRFVLLDIFEHLGGVSWHDNNRWQTSEDHCTWFGIECDGKSHRVTSVRLYGNNLLGNLSDVKSLGNLSHLEFLGLSYNFISGPLPPTLALLSKLSFLGLCGNSLSGTISAVLIQSLPNLQVIMLADNLLSGPLPQMITSAPALDFVDVSQNLLSGILPSFSPAFLPAERGGLRVLEVQDNRFHGNVPPSLLLRLQTLWISGNNLTLPASLGNDSSVVPSLLHRLSAYDGVLFEGEGVPTWIVKWASMAQQCDLRGISTCSNLSPSDRTIIRTFCGGCVVPPKPKLPPMDNAVSPCGKNNFSQVQTAQCNALVALYDATGGNTWEDNTGWLSGLHYCSWATVSCDKNYNVVGLTLFGNNLHGTLPSPETLSSLSSLQFLGLDYNNLSSALMNIATANLTSLTYLGLTANSLSEPIPWDALSLGSPLLQDLLLSFNNLSGSLPADPLILSRWKNTLLGLEVAGNDLSGAVPPSIGVLRSLLYLDLSNNSRLSGELPARLLQNMDSIVGLDLQSLPLLTGALPNTTALQNPNLRRVTIENSLRLDSPSKSWCAWARSKGRRGEERYCDVCASTCEL